MNKKAIFGMLMLMIIPLFSSYTPPDNSNINLILNGSDPYTPPHYSVINLILDDGAPAGDTCTYVSGDWNVLCSDNCVITSNVDMGDGATLTLEGSGTFNVEAIITASEINYDNDCSLEIKNGVGELSWGLVLFS